MVNTILKVAAVTSLVLGGIVVAATVFTAKEIDNAGDNLGKKNYTINYIKKGFTLIEGE
jgi:hypothetical protein